VNILFLNPNLSRKRGYGHHLFKLEIERQHNVVNYGKGYENFDPNLFVEDIIKKFCKVKPDIILTYFWKYWNDIKGLNLITDIPKVHYIVDYTKKHGHYDQQTKALLRDKYDLIFAPYDLPCHLVKENKICSDVIKLPFSVDINKFKKTTMQKRNVVMACFNAQEKFYPNRSIIRELTTKAGYNHIKGAIFKNYIKAINMCKVSITHTDIFNHFNMKYTEILSCGGFLLTDKPKNMNELGYVNNKHFVIYNDLDDFVDKLKYYMNPKHDKERERIEKIGMEFVRKNHNNTVRVKQMTNIIKNRFDIK